MILLRGIDGVVRGVAVLSICTALLATIAHAQVGLPGVEDSVLITYSPIHPGPGDSVRMEARSSVLDLKKTNLTWRANGKMIAQGAGIDSANITLGGLGTITTIDVSIAAEDDITAVASVKIAPAELDLLIDSDGYTPPFYRGRSHASVGTNVRFLALPFFKRSNGTYIPSSDITFVWTKNGEAMTSISGKGKSSAVIPVEHLFGTERIAVEARSDDGIFVQDASYTLAPEQPLIMLYEKHPLYGILYHEAAAATLFIPDSEVTFVAVPYFAAVQRAEDPALVYEWSMNNKTNTTSSKSPNTITLDSDDNAGTITFLNLNLTHRTNYYLGAKGSWNINFSPEAAALDQFRPVDE